MIEKMILHAGDERWARVIPDAECSDILIMEHPRDKIDKFVGRMDGPVLIGAFGSEVYRHPFQENGIGHWDIHIKNDGTVFFSARQGAYYTAGTHI